MTSPDPPPPHDADPGPAPATSQPRRSLPARVIRSPWTFQLLLVGAIAALVIWRVDLGEVGRTFRSADYHWVPLALAIYVVSRVVHTWEWQMTLTKVGRAPFGGMFGAILIGTLVNAVVPASAGDVAKVQIVAHPYGLSRPGLIAGRGAESVGDAVIMVMFIAVSFTLPGTGFASTNTLILMALGATAAFAGVFVGSRMLPREFPHWRVFRALPQRAYDALCEIWPRLHDGFELVRQPRLLVLAVLLNLFGWFVDISILWTYGQAFHVNIPFAAYLSVTVAVAIITTFPITFGNVGTFEFALLKVLALYSVSSDTALAYAVGTHVFSTVFNIGLGLIAMLAMRVSPQEVFSFSAKQKDEPAAIGPIQVR
jgi:uncharacterized protein (TIRG00374 family)